MIKRIPDKLISKDLLSLTFRRLVIATSIEQLTLSVTGIVDCAVVGQFIGSNGLSGMQLAMPIFFLYAVISQIFSSGLTVILSKDLSLGQKEKAQKTFSYIHTSTLLIGLVFLLIGAISPQIVLMAIAGKTDLAVKKQALAYLIPILIGAPIILLYDIIVAVIILEGQEAQLVKSVTALIVTDIIADFIAAFTHMGLLGIAIASALAYGAALIVLLKPFIKHELMLQLQLMSVKIKYVLPVVLTGLPLGIKFFCSLIVPIFTNRMMLMYGSIAGLAALSVQDAIHYLPNAVCLGIATTVLLVSGILSGEQDHRAIEDGKRIVLRWGFLNCTLMAIVLALLSPLLIRLFTSEKEIYHLGVSALRWYLLCVPFSAVNQATAAYLQGIGKSRLSSIHIIFNSLILPIIMTYLLASQFHVTGIYASFAAIQIAMVFISIYMAQKYEIEDTSSTFKVDQSMLIETLDDAINASRSVDDLCRSLSVPGNKAHALALCVEELAINTVEHGFTKDNKDHHLEMRIIISDDYLILRLRDDCKKFNLKERYDMLNPDDIGSNLGLRIVFGLADQINYSSAINLNNVCIQISL